MIDVHDLPTLNAALNSLSFGCLAAGYWAIRRKRVALHRRLMLAAVTVSGLFLASYVTYHAAAGSRPFEGQGVVRAVYFIILVSHVVLAALIVPLVLVTLRRALGRSFADHARVARWTWPLWAYVSLTGVLVYLMLYVLFPSGE